MRRTFPETRRRCSNKMTYHTTSARSATLATSLLLALGVNLSSTSTALAQTYVLVDLTPTAGNAVAMDVSGGIAAGYSSPGVFGTAYRASLWDGIDSADLHPSALADDPVTGVVGRSSILGGSAGLQVGWVAGTPTGGRAVPVIWRDTAASATLLTIPFAHFGGQANATDGAQVVGYATGQNRDGTTFGPSQAMLWDATSGAGVSLGDGGNPSIAYGVGGGAQVGLVNKGTVSAALWRGSAKSLVVLHPKNAVVSVANATDGVRQVGYAGYDVRVRVEAVKGNKDQRFNYAMLWTGTAASAANLHPYPVNAMPGVNLTQSYALGMNGSWIVGHAIDVNKSGSAAAAHAIVWDSQFQSVDLNAFLPGGFVGAQAVSVDEQGNVSGFMSKIDGTRHAVIWRVSAPE